MIGQVISHYKILEHLGGGGMGVVYKAQDLKLDRTVALKFLPPDLTRDPEARERFVQEAKAASALQHANICVVHDIDETPDGQIFLSMEYLEGETLKKKIEHACPPDRTQEGRRARLTDRSHEVGQGRLRIGDGIDIAIQVAQGLAKAHEHGIIHRDIKPANIMVTKDGVAKIVDFGLAKLAGQGQLTRTGSTIGTAAYMSPEQARGEDVDHRTDIWSLGAVLYEMLAGVLAFGGEYEQAVVFQIMNSPPAPLTAVRTGVPAELERIVNKCLEKNRDERYQTAADLVADLRHMMRTMEGGTTMTQPSSAPTPMSGQRPRWWYWVAAVILLAVAAAIVFIKAPRQTAVSGEKSIAVLPFADFSPDRDQDYFCNGMTEELINRLSNIKDLRVPARTSAFFFKGKTDDIREIGTKLHVQTVLEGSVRKAGNQLRITAQLINVADGYHLWSETYDRKLDDVFAIQDEISSAIVDALQLKLSPQETQRLSEHGITDVKAYECYLKAWRQISRFDEKSIDSALAYLQSAIDIMGDNAELYSGMAAAYFMYANIGVGQEEDLERAEEYAKKALALKPDLATALVHLGALSAYKDYPEGRRDCFRFNSKALSANPSSIAALRAMAIDYAQIGRPQQAFAYADMFERLDPLNPWRHVVRAVCYEYACQFGPAVEQCRMFYQADSTSPLAQNLYVYALAANGNRNEALAVINRISTGRNAITLFCRLLEYGLLNDRERALRVMTPEFQRTCWRDFEWSYNVAEGLSYAGAKREALDWLENAINRGFINYPYIQCDPAMNTIRGEERFKKLLERAKYEWEHFETPE
jgi:TolB-like protein